MRVLVVEDSLVHQNSARKTLVDHDITIVGNYREAEKLLCDDKSFDACLCDLTLPVPTNHMTNPDNFVGVQMPLGTILALLALKQGIRLVAILTDAYHHADPASASLEAFAYGPFAIGDARVLCEHDAMCLSFYDEANGEEVPEEFLCTEAGEKKYPATGYLQHQGLIRAKNWGVALTKLIESQKA